MPIQEKIISRLFQDSPSELPVESVQIVDGGKVVFKVNQFTLTGKSKVIIDTFEKVQDPKQFFSTFHIDTMGQLFVFSNLSTFLKIAEEISKQCYDTNLIQAQHIHFGMRRLDEDWLEFSFHVSLLHDIVVDTLYNHVNVIEV